MGSFRYYFNTLERGKRDREALRHWRTTLNPPNHLEIIQSIYVMRSLTIFALLVDVGVCFLGRKRLGLLPPTETRASPRVSTGRFPQRLDHFSHVDNRTWLQRYYVNDEYFDAASRDRVFLQIGGESAASVGWMTFGSWAESAREYGALMFMLEHRFYGESHPFADTSVENLRYLSTHQALEDVAAFVAAMNVEYRLADDVKWILFGGSYPASMATWLRQKYPHLVAGAVAASGPLEAVLDFSDYLQVVADDLRSHSERCATNLGLAFEQLADFLVPGRDASVYAYVDGALDLCNPIETSLDAPKDVAMLHEMLVDDNFAAVAQYNKNYNRAVSVDDLCEILVDEDAGTVLDRLGEVNRLALKRSGKSCVDYKYDNVVAQLRDVTLSPSTMMRQWLYQTCTEFGFYQTSNQETKVFGDRLPLSFFTGLCGDVFGDGFDEGVVAAAVATTNTRYGAKDARVTNVVHVHGSFDPWHPLGVTRTRDDASPAFLINGTAHCANMYPETDGDPEELKKVRREVHRLIGVWLSTAKSPAVSNDGSAIPIVAALSLMLALK
ncbi:thymus-specific serine protease-like [Cylas formicarius]|uniref:thymus-specific serine protease-like n=1 Tax=Cylas formicarius TaxID=197179 RepID=UPI002958CCED|nr:thymus-specific serine protease-like [Cylas formicarius]